MTARIVLMLLACAATALGQAAPAKDPHRETRRKLFREKFLDHFNLGVEAPIEWIAETREKNGCRWDFKAQYLSGGAALPEKPFWLQNGNTGRTFVAEARKAGTTAWLTFYALAASAPARYKPGPAEATVLNARVPNTMREYFTLFKTFLDGAAKEAPTPVMVQIEPDEWCHLLLAAGMDPAKVDVKVGATGLEELKGLPDNLFGFASAFKRLRDLYAPTNVLLGCNPSAFDANGSMTGAKMGATFKALCGEWDFAVHETGDRNKGMNGKAPPYNTDIERCGNLENHLKWTADFHAASGLYVFVWQVAAGNTYFATCNNTPGHYCDNLAQMLLEDYPKNPTLQRYIKAGCAGWIFLGGQDPDTRCYDYKKDGITNPPAIPGNLGNKSEYADDDGGYLRLRGAAYYKKPAPILGKGAAQKPPTEAPAAAPTPAPVKLNATAPPAAIAAWDAKLRAAVAEDLKAGRKPKFHLKVVNQPAEATAIDDEGVLTFRSDVGNFPCRWVDLTLQDRRNLAVARIRESKPPLDLCLAAFYQLACGDEAAGLALLKGIPTGDADEVTAAFKQ
jgi:hypothetical protein